MNSNKIVIFLFTCIYNDRENISRLFDSISNQTSANFIYYLYDDGSSENYDDLFLNLQKKLKEKGIKSYFEKGKKNLGINKATEHCLLVLRDKFKECTHFAWINSDDWLNDNYIERMTNQINKHTNCALFIPNLNKYIKVDDKLVFKRKGFSNNDFVRSTNYLIDAFYKRTIIYSHFAVNKEKFLVLNPKCFVYDNSNEMFFYNDVCVIFLISCSEQNTLYFNECLSNYYIHSDSLSLKAHEESKTKGINYWICQNKYINQVNKDLTLRYCKIMSVIVTHAICLKQIRLKNFKLVKKLYKKSLNQFKTLKIDKKFLYPFFYSPILYKMPRFSYIVLMLIDKWRALR